MPSLQNCGKMVIVHLEVSALRLYNVLSLFIMGFSTGTMTGFFQPDRLKRINFSLSISRVQNGSFPKPVKSIPCERFLFHTALLAASFLLVRIYLEESVTKTPLIFTPIRVSFFFSKMIAVLLF